MAGCTGERIPISLAQLSNLLDWSTVSATLVRTDAALASSLRISVMRLARRLRNERTDSALSLNQLSVIACLDRHGTLGVGELAQQERVRPPSMTRTVASLVELGYVTRTTHPTDGRQVVVALAEPGRALLREDRRRREAWLARQLRTLTPDERDVLRRAAPILERLTSS